RAEEQPAHGRRPRLDQVAARPVGLDALAGVEADQHADQRGIERDAEHQAKHEGGERACHQARDPAVPASSATTRSRATPWPALTSTAVSGPHSSRATAAACAASAATCTAPGGIPAARAA